MPRWIKILLALSKKCISECLIIIDVKKYLEKVQSECKKCTSLPFHTPIFLNGSSKPLGVECDLMKTTTMLARTLDMIGETLHVSFQHFYEKLLFLLL